jgi:hypothetical protein
MRVALSCPLNNFSYCHEYSGILINACKLKSKRERDKRSQRKFGLGCVVRENRSEK